MAGLLRIPFTPVVIGAAAVAIVYLTFTTGQYFVHNYQLRQEERRLEREIGELQLDHRQLTAVRDYLQSDEYVEDVARRTLGLVRPGETLVIVSGSADTAQRAADADTPRTPRAWWKELFVPAPTPTPAVP